MKPLKKQKSEQPGRVLDFGAGAKKRRATTQRLADYETRLRLIAGMLRMCRPSGALKQVVIELIEDAP